MDLLGNNAESCFLLKVRDDTMRGADIAEGDWVVVAMDLPVGDGDIVVAIVDGDAIVRTLDSGGLVAADPAQPVSCDRNVTVVGRVVATVHRTIRTAPTG